MGNKNSTWNKVAMDIIISDGLNYVFWKIKLTSGWGMPGEGVVHDKRKIRDETYMLRGRRRLYSSTALVFSGLEILLAYRKK